MNLRAESIPTEKLKDAAVEAARNVLGERLEKLGVDGCDICIFPDIGLVGARLPDIALGDITASEMVDLSQQIAGDAGGVARGAEPVAILGERIGLVGWFPRDPILFERFG